MNQWKLTEEVDQTWCEKCRQIKPPIYELVYKRAADAAAQYHYVCEGCAAEIAGADTVQIGLPSLFARRERQRATARANFQGVAEKRTAERRASTDHRDALEHAGGK